MDIAADKLDFLGGDFLLPDRASGCGQHFGRQIDAHQSRHVSQAMEIPASPAPGVQDGDRTGEGRGHSLENGSQTSMAFGGDLQFVVLPVTDMNLGVSRAKALFDGVKIDGSLGSTLVLRTV